MNDGLVAYTIICIVLVLSPGPNTFLIFSTATSAGKRDSFVKILGLLVATYIHGLLSIFGVSILLFQFPLLFVGMKILGALYLCYLGMKFILNSFKDNINNLENNHRVSKKNTFQSFKDGFITQLLNPKVSMFYIAAFPQFISFNNESYYLQGIGLITIHAASIGIWFSLMTILIDKASNFSGNKKLNKAITLLSGLCLIYFSAILMLQPPPQL